MCLWCCWKDVDGIAGFNGIVLGKIWIENVGDIDF
jgi:hypothetical protein